jgi:hypothetical protein
LGFKLAVTKSLLSIAMTGRVENGYSRNDWLASWLGQYYFHSHDYLSPHVKYRLDWFVRPNLSQVPPYILVVNRIGRRVLGGGLGKLLYYTPTALEYLIDSPVVGALVELVFLLD